MHIAQCMLCYAHQIGPSSSAIPWNQLSSDCDDARTQDVAAHGGSRVLRYDPTIGKQGAFYFQELPDSITGGCGSTHVPALPPLPALLMSHTEPARQHEPSGPQGNSGDGAGVQQGHAMAMPATVEQSGADDDGELTESLSDLESELTLGSLATTPGRSPLRWRASSWATGPGAGAAAATAAAQAHQSAQAAIQPLAEAGERNPAGVVGGFAARLDMAGARGPAGTGPGGVAARKLLADGLATAAAQRPQCPTVEQSPTSPVRRVAGSASAAAWAAAAAARAILQQSPVLARAAGHSMPAGVQPKQEAAAAAQTAHPQAPCAAASADPSPAAGRTLKPCDLQELLRGTGCAKQEAAQQHQPLQPSQSLNPQRHQPQQQADGLWHARVQQPQALLQPLNVMPASSNDSTALSGPTSLGNGLAPAGGLERTTSGRRHRSTAELHDDATSRQQGLMYRAAAPTPAFALQLSSSLQATSIAPADQHLQLRNQQQTAADWRVPGPTIPTSVHAAPALHPSSHAQNQAQGSGSGLGMNNAGAWGEPVPRPAPPQPALQAAAPQAAAQEGPQQALRGQLSSTLMPGAGLGGMRQPHNERADVGGADQYAGTAHDFDDSLMDLLAEVESMHDDPDAAAYRPKFSTRAPAASAVRGPGSVPMSTAAARKFGHNGVVNPSHQRRTLKAQPAFAPCWEESEDEEGEDQGRRSDNGDVRRVDVGRAGLTLRGWGQRSSSSSSGRKEPDHVHDREDRVQQMLRHRQAQRRGKLQGFDGGPGAHDGMLYEEDDVQQNDVVSAILAAEEGLGADRETGQGTRAGAVLHNKRPAVAGMGMVAGTRGLRRGLGSGR